MRSSRTPWPFPSTQHPLDPVAIEEKPLTFYNELNLWPGLVLPFRALRKHLFPIRHALVYNWSFGEAPDLAGVAENLARELFYVLNPEANILTVTSKTKPTAVIFTIIQRNTDGGELVLIQTPEGRYTFNELNHNINIFGRKAGINIKSKRNSNPGESITGETHKQ